MSCLSHLGFTSCKADPDVWLRPVDDRKGSECYDYLLVYSDDVMVICKDPRVVLQHLDKYFKVKDDSIQPLNIYLGRKLKPVMMPSGKFSGDRAPVNMCRRQFVTWRIGSRNEIPNSQPDVTPPCLHHTNQS